ncbi:uncharacterized protein Tco025E_03763 [Trypanosoma conorhini]|uniref:Uncharacterized protein n=1 Tax=Trypanosoma conorhini TaxID=83891 RepID=A0A3R7PIN4_9TRYP|nr:uncharacterized protein Tco025E_03763 [Trypanosoma conorhini]RNF20501.1 hypothetical protein Tco025E_03763 [Trypanosoma conorhini]
MSEVLLVLPPAPACSTGESENLSTFSFSVNHSLNYSRRAHSENEIVASAAGSPTRRVSPHPPPLHAEESYQRMLITLECQLEFMTLAQWRLAMEARLKTELLRGRMQTVMLQEALLQHRVTRVAHVEERFGQPVGCPTYPRLMQDEFFEREYVALQETVGFLAIWSKLIPARLSMLETPTFFAEVTPKSPGVGLATFTFAPSLLTATGTDNRLNALRKTIRSLRGDLAAVRDEAEVLSFALAEEQPDDSAGTEGARSVTNTTGMCKGGGSEHASYAITVMRLAARQVDELRGKVFGLTKRLCEREQSLDSAQRCLADAKERGAQLQQILNATEEVAAAAASQCQLRVSRAAASAQHDGAGKQLENTPETYAMRVLQELRRSALMLGKEIDCQKERTRRELRERDAVLEMVYSQVGRLASLMPHSLSFSGWKQEGVNMTNITLQLESIITAVTALKSDHDEGLARGAQLFPSVPRSSEVAALRSTIEQMRSTIELLLCEAGRAGEAHFGVASAVPALPIANCRTDVLTMVLRRLEEVRGEKIFLELQLEEKRRHPPPLVSQNSCHGQAIADDAEGGTGPGDNTWFQSVHRLSEASILLQDELRLEREVGLSLRARLTDSERFIRELQKQCRRLRQSGRFDAYEVMEQLGSDSDEDAAEESDGDSGDDGTCMPFMESQQARGKKAIGGMCPSEELCTASISRRHAKSPIASTDTSFSLRPLAGIAGPLASMSEGERIACARDQHRLLEAMREVHGIKLSTLLMDEERQRSSCNPHDIWGVFLACSISLHTFFKAAGPSVKFARHVAVIYPLPPTMAYSLPVRQLLCPLKGRRTPLHAKNTGASVEVFDLREEFQSTGNYLRGCMDVYFSQDGRFMYALTSADADVIARLCAPDCLNIPAERQFRFAGSLPKGMPIHKRGGSSGSNSNNNNNKSSNTINHNIMYAGEADAAPLPMDMLGWCGRGGMCAWAVDCMQFDSAAEKVRFEKHLQSEYRLVLRLSAREVQHFVGGSMEMMGLNSADRAVARLFMSRTAYEALSPVHRVQLLQWYGGPQAVTLLNLVNIERVTAAPLRRLVVLVQWHGRVPLSKTPTGETLERFGIQHPEQRHLLRQFVSSQRPSL